MTCTVDPALDRVERELERSVRRDPALRPKLNAVRRRCAEETRRERSVRNAQARAERQRHEAERTGLRESVRRQRLQTKRENFELRQQRKQAGEFVGRDYARYGGIAIAASAGIGILYALFR